MIPNEYINTWHIQNYTNIFIIYLCDEINTFVTLIRYAVKCFFFLKPCLQWSPTLLIL